jgi:3-hydroxyisobutyrate dehydrogenase-like beta-hydroxyacid dehydrogenase
MVADLSADQQAKRGAMAQQNVGMVGLGIMGSAMSANLARAGFHVVGYDIAPRRGAELRRSGGIAARSPREVAKRANIIVTSLPSANALSEVAAELAESASRGTIIIETSTLPIAAKEAARNALARRGVILLDCPLSGTGAQARVKDLIIYVSGDRAAYRKAVPVMEGFTRANYYVGAFGAGSKMKFVANLLVAIHNVAAAEAMVLGMKAGLDPALVLKVVSDGAGSSRMFQVRGPMMVKGDYSEATMKNEVWQKDMTIIADFARKIDCPTPLFAASAPIYNAAMAMGLAKEDTGAVCAVLEEMAGNPRRRKKR